MPDDSLLLHSARGGDEQAYGKLVMSHRGELHAHCYRMLASVQDADDAVQEAMLRAWKGLGRFEARSSVRTWLFKIATHTALDIARRRPKRELPLGYGQRSLPSAGPGEPAVGVEWAEPYPDDSTRVSGSPEARYEELESLELAYVAALQQLPARQRAVFILREVLSFSATETASILDTSVAAVNSALQRARARIAGRMPEVSQQFELQALGDDETRLLTERYARAIEDCDVESLLGLLKTDATWSMPPHPGWFSGHGAIAGFLRDDVMTSRWRHVPTRVSGQLAIGGYLYSRERACYVATALDVLALDGGRIGAVIAYLTPEAFASDTPGGVISFARYGLPDELGP